MSKKKRYNFTLDEDLMSWFKMFCKEHRLTASAFLNQEIYRLYIENTNQPRNVLRSTPTKLNR